MIRVVIQAGAKTLDKIADRNREYSSTKDALFWAGAASAAKPVWST
jgi:hypothetical protein